MRDRDRERTEEGNRNVGIVGKGDRDVDGNGENKEEERNNIGRGWRCWRKGHVHFICGWGEDKEEHQHQCKFGGRGRDGGEVQMKGQQGQGKLKG